MRAGALGQPSLCRRRSRICADSLAGWARVHVNIMRRLRIARAANAHIKYVSLSRHCRHQRVHACARGRRRLVARTRARRRFQLVIKAIVQSTNSLFYYMYIQSRVVCPCGRCVSFCVQSGRILRNRSIRVLVCGRGWLPCGFGFVRVRRSVATSV